MANIRVRHALSRLSIGLVRVRNHVAMYSGISNADAWGIESEAQQIVEVAASIAAMAREAQGNRSAKGLVRRVRKALGFTSP